MQKPKNSRNTTKTFVIEINDSAADELANKLIANGFNEPKELEYGWQFRHPFQRKSVCFYWSSKRSVWKAVWNFDPEELK